MEVEAKKSFISLQRPAVLLILISYVLLFSEKFSQFIFIVNAIQRFGLDTIQ